MSIKRVREKIRKKAPYALEAFDGVVSDYYERLKIRRATKKKETDFFYSNTDNLCAMFDWWQTKEGHQYWARVARDIGDLEKNMPLAEVRNKLVLRLYKKKLMKYVKDHNGSFPAMLAMDVLDLIDEGGEDLARRIKVIADVCPYVDLKKLLGEFSGLL